MRGALRVMEAQESGVRERPASSVVTAREGSVEPKPLRERSLIGRLIADGEFVTMVNWFVTMTLNVLVAVAPTLSVAVTLKL